LNRQSDRSYLDKPVEADKLARIIECARMAPSACNAQPSHIIVADNAELRAKIADATSEWILGMNHFAKQAPLLLVVIEEEANITSNLGGGVKRIHYPLMDIGIIAEHICLASTAEGLGSCMIGWFDEAKVKNICAIPASKRVQLIIAPGYSNARTRTKIRKPIEKIVSYNSYAQSWKELTALKD